MFYMLLNHYFISSKIGFLGLLRKKKSNKTEWTGTSVSPSTALKFCQMQRGPTDVWGA
jgi:hypothetical protein